MKERLFLFTLFMCSALLLWGQQERKVIRQGIKSFEQGDYGNAEVEFRKATEMDASSFEADFNTGAALYGQDKYEESLKHYQDLLDRQAGNEALKDNSRQQAHVWHNMGNSLLESQKYAESIEAYKRSLRLNPGDMDTKYNLAYARRKLQEQQEQQQQQQNQDQQQDQNQDQQDQQQDQNQDQQDQQQDQSQDQQNQNQDQQQDQKQDQQQQPVSISKEDAERMLSAIQEQEKQVKDKVDKKKAATAKVKTEKDW